MPCILGQREYVLIGIQFHTCDACGIICIKWKNINQTYIGGVISTPTPAMILLTRIVV
jgi:hypothetical protein